MKGGLCFTCAEKGHISRDCPDNKYANFRGKSSSKKKKKKKNSI